MYRRILERMKLRERKQYENRAGRNGPGNRHIPTRKKRRERKNVRKNMQENWNEKSVAELRAQAREWKISGTGSMRKQELIERLQEAEKEREAGNQPEAGKQAAAERTEEIADQPGTGKAPGTERLQRSAARRPAEEPRRSPVRTSRENQGDRRRVQRSDRNDRLERGDRTERTDRIDRADRTERTDRTDRAERMDRADRMERGDRMERPDRSERMERTDRVDNMDRQQRQERQDRQDRQDRQERYQGWNTGSRNDGTTTPEELQNLDSGQTASGILEVMPEGYGFIRSENYLPGEDDVYVSPSQIRRFNMKTGDIITGKIRIKTGQEKYVALLYVQSINDEPPAVAEHRQNFEDLTPVFPKERLHLEIPGGSVSVRIVDLLSPIGKGQRGMIVSPPKAGKTTLLKDIAKAVKINHPEMHIIILLIDERPEEVTDIKESIEGENVEVIYSTFDELPDHHKRVSEMVLGRAKRLVEHGRDVIILLDSITRLARAYNLTVAPSGRTLSGGLDPAALHMPKKFFGAARCMREGGSLTILATALVDTGSRMDDVVFEEFKGTGNMELVLDRKLSERRIFPAIDILKSGTRRDDLLLTEEEQEAVTRVRRAMQGMKQEEAVEEVLRLFARTRSNQDFVEMAKKIRL